MFYYMLAVTLAVTAFIAHQVLRRLAVLRSGGKAIGTVVGHEIEDGYEATVDHPVVRFTDHLGQDHTFRAEGPRSQSTRLGARVPVVDGASPIPKSSVLSHVISFSTVRPEPFLARITEV